MVEFKGSADKSPEFIKLTTLISIPESVNTKRHLYDELKRIFCGLIQMRP